MNDKEKLNSGDIGGVSPDGPKDLIRLFRRASRGMSRAYHRRGHTQHAQIRLLFLLSEKDFIDQRDLMHMLNIRSASLSELLAKLEKNELISRKRSEEDRRRFIVSITDEGLKTVHKEKAVFSENAKSIFAVFNEEERIQLSTLLEKLVVSLEEDYPCEGGTHGMRHHHHGHGRGGMGRSGRGRLDGNGRGAMGHGARHGK